MTKIRMTNTTTATCLVGALAVVIGAFGAHMLSDKIPPEQLANFKTGVLYHFVHTLAALAICMAPPKYHSRLVKLSVIFFLVGILFFSGSLYLLATRSLTGLSATWLGPLTPLGGLFFIAGWIGIAIGLRKGFYSN